VQGRTANDCRLAPANVLHRQYIGIPGIRHVIDHQHASAGDRHTQRLHQPCPALAPGASPVMHNAHTGHRHDAQCVCQQACRHKPAARDGHDEVRLKTGRTNSVRHSTREPVDAAPGHHVTAEFALHRCTQVSAFFVHSY